MTTRLTAVLHSLARVITLVLGSLMIANVVPMSAGNSDPDEVLSPWRQRGVTPGKNDGTDELRQRFDQGVTMLQMGEFTHAITAFHRVLALQPKLPEAHVNMGFAFFGLGDFAGARRFFDSAIVLEAGQANAYYGLALSLSRLGDVAAAKTAMHRYLELSAPNDPFRVQAAETLMALVEQEAARTVPAVPQSGRN